MPAPLLEVELYKPLGPAAKKAISIPLLTASEFATAESNENFMLVNVGKLLNRSDEAGAGQFLLLPSYSFGREDTKLADWTRLPEATETQEIEQICSDNWPDIRNCLGLPSSTEMPTGFADLFGNLNPEDYEQLATLAAALVSGAQAPTDAEDQTRLWELWDVFRGLRLNGFWEEKSNLFGDGCVGLYRGCSVPNIHWRIRSNWNLQSDRAFTIQFHKPMVDQDQEDPYLRLEFGLFCMEIRQGTEINWYHYKSTLTLTQREEYLAELRQIEAGNKQVAEQKEQITQLRTEINGIRHTAKSEKRKTTIAEENEIATKEAAVNDLKQQNRSLDRADQDRRKELQDLLYEARDSVTLDETVESFYGQTIALTFIPQRRGFVSVHLGRPGSPNAWIYEAKSVRELRAWSNMWLGVDGRGKAAEQPITISSNGGAFWYRVSYVIVEKYCRIRSAPHSTDRDLEELEEADCILIPNWDPVPATWDAQTEGWDPDTQTCTLDAKIIPTQGLYGKFNWELSLTTDTYFMPIIYALQLYVPPVPRDTTLETSLWRSSDHPGQLLTADPRTAQLGEAVGYEVVFRDDGNSLGPLLPHMVNMQIRVRNLSSGRNYFTGVVTEAERDPINIRENRIRMVALDRSVTLAQDMIEVETPGDGLPLGQYVAMLLWERGYTDDEVRVPSCPENDRILPVADPGQLPAIRPEFGSKRAEILGNLFENHVYGMERYWDEDGVFRWQPESADIRPDIIFHPQHQFLADRRVMWEVKERLDFAEFFNDFYVEGAEIPGSKGRRYAARYQNFSSVYNPDHITYYGSWKADDPVREDSLKSQEKVIVALRRRVALRGFPKWIIEFGTHYHDDILQQSRFYVYIERRGAYYQVPVKVHAITSVSHSDDRMTLEVEVLIHAFGKAML